MKDLRCLVFLPLLGWLSACGDWVGDKDAQQAPHAEKSPHVWEIHGERRVDHYHWMRDDSRSKQEVLDHLRRENSYSAAMMAHTESLQKRLYQEITGRLKVEDRSVPVRSKDYEYYYEYRPGMEHPIYLRRKFSEAGKEVTPELLLDVNEQAKGYDYYQTGSWQVSPGQALLAYTEDTVGRRQYRLRIRDIASGINHEDSVANVSPSIAWAADNQTLFYVRKDPVTLLPYQVYRHKLGDDPANDVLVYEEAETGFYTSVHQGRTGDFIVITLDSTSATEVRLIDARQPDSEPVVFLPRRAKHEYRVRFAGEAFYVLTNLEAKNFRIMRVHREHLGDPVAILTQWQEIVPHDDKRLIQDLEVFDAGLVVDERFDGLPYLRLMSLDGELIKAIDFPDPVYTVRLYSNPEAAAPAFYYVYDSLARPESVYAFEFATQTSRLVKQEEVVGNFDPSLYQAERLWVPVRDGERVPVSLVYRKDRFKKGENALYLDGYGSYGYSLEPYFDAKRLSLLDRGVVYAMVHVRGGSELGRRWYESGRQFNKKNTFNDFIDSTRYLVDKGWGQKEKVFAQGASAGGLIMGVIANEAPELYRGIIAHVPFVDVVTTMLDGTIPLTEGEYEEWGNPHQATDYHYMLSYSPYDQVRSQAYPAMLVTTGLHDSQVQYFEPAKWVAKLREYNTSTNPVLFKIEMSAGHSGASGRYERYKMDALEYAFILDHLNKN